MCIIIVDESQACCGDGSLQCLSGFCLLAFNILHIQFCFLRSREKRRSNTRIRFRLCFWEQNARISVLSPTLSTSPSQKFGFISAPPLGFSFYRAHHCVDYSHNPHNSVHTRLLKSSQLWFPPLSMTDECASLHRAFVPCTSASSPFCFFSFPHTVFSYHGVEASLVTEPTRY